MFSWINTKNGTELPLTHVPVCVCVAAGLKLLDSHQETEAVKCDLRTAPPKILCAITNCKIHVNWSRDLGSVFLVVSQNKLFYDKISCHILAAFLSSVTLFLNSATILQNKISWWSLTVTHNGHNRISCIFCIKHSTSVQRRSYKMISVVTAAACGQQL